MTLAWASMRFALALVVLLYLPGRWLLGRAPGRLRPLDSLALSLLLGIASSSIAYWAAAASGWRGLFLAWPLGASAAALWRLRAGPPLEWRSFRPRPGPWLLALTVATGMGVLALLPLYYRNLLPQRDGGLSYYPLPDLVFHVSIANEITRAVPPQVPFLPGQPLAYHYGMDLLAALFSDWAGLSLADASVRFVPTLLLAVAMLAAFVFCRAWLQSDGAAALATALVFLGEDLSFVPGALLGSAGSWPVQFFGVPSTVSLFQMNPMLPALAFLFGGLLCLSSPGGSNALGRLPLIGAALLAFSVEYKVFATAHVLLALALATGLRFLTLRDTRLVAPTAASALLALVLAAPTVLEGSRQAAVRLEAWPYVPGALIQTGLWESWLGRAVRSFLEGGDGRVSGALVFAGIALPAYLAATFGARLLGLPRVWGALRSPSRSDPTRLVVAVLIVLGPLISLCLSITPAGYPPRSLYNNAVWFFVQSKYFAWIPAVEALLAWSRPRTAPVRALALGLLLAVAVPATAQHFWLCANDPLQSLPRDELAMLEFLASAAAPGDVALAPEELAAPIVMFTPCRATLLSVFPESFLSMPDLTERHGALASFWSSWRRGAYLAEVVTRLRAKYIVSDKRGSGPGPLPAELRRVYENDSFVVLAVADRERTGRP